jgi:hypothetical protein
VLLFTSSFSKKQGSLKGKMLHYMFLFACWGFGILGREKRRKMQAEEGKGNGEHLLVISL